MKRLIATYRVGESVQVSLPGKFPGGEEDPLVIDDPIKINPPGGRILIVGPEFHADTPEHSKFAADHDLKFNTGGTEFRTDEIVGEIVRSWQSSRSKMVNVDLSGFSRCLGEFSVSRMAEHIASETKCNVNVTLW